MKVIKKSSIHGGAELIEEKFSELNDEIYRIIEEIDIDSLSRISKYLIHEEFRKHKFFSDHSAKKFTTEENFIKNKVMVNIRCESSAESDIAKLEYFYNEGIIEAAVEIMPNYREQIDFSCGDIFEKIVERLQNKFLNVPTKVILVDVD